MPIKGVMMKLAHTKPLRPGHREGGKDPGPDLQGWLLWVWRAKTTHTGHMRLGLALQPLAALFTATVRQAEAAAKERASGGPRMKLAG